VVRSQDVEKPPTQSTVTRTASIAERQILAVGCPYIKPAIWFERGSESRTARRISYANKNGILERLSSKLHAKISEERRHMPGGGGEHTRDCIV